VFYHITVTIGPTNDSNSTMAYADINSKGSKSTDLDVTQEHNCSKSKPKKDSGGDRGEVSNLKANDNHLNHSKISSNLLSLIARIR